LSTVGQQRVREDAVVVVVEERMDALEARTRALEARVAELEGRAPEPRTRPAPARHTSATHWVAPLSVARPKVARAKAARVNAASLEDLLGGRVLAWVGGLAVLVGIVFLLAIAVSRGWIGEEARTVMAALASLGMLGFGIRLFEHRGRTEAALASTAAGIAALFATITVATQVYDLVGAPVGMLAALAVGATATWLAVRWRAQGIGALGIVGALAGPLLVGAPYETGTIALLLIATASATAVLVWQRWDWLAFASFGLTLPQWLWWLFDKEPAPALVVAVIAGFGVLYAAAAAGFEVRMRAPRLRISATILLALNAFACGAAGWFALDQVASAGVADGWLVALAAAHVIAGAAGLRSRRVSHELGLVVLGLGTILADVAFSQVASGLPLVLGWAAGAVGFAGLMKHAGGRRADVTFAGLGLGGHLTLALGHALATEAPADALGANAQNLTLAIAALAAVAAGCFVSARLAQEGHRTWRIVLDAVGLAVVAYVSAIALDGLALTLAWVGEGVALARLARSTDDDVAKFGSAACLGAALAFTLATLAPPAALVYGLDTPLPALAALAAAAGGTVLAALWLPGLDPRVRLAVGIAGALVALYAASAGLVTPFQPGGDTAGLPLAELGVRQQGQALLSAFWALLGLGALVVGLLRDLRPLRIAGLALLATAVGKVFLFDLASLTSVYRVASFIALGLLLLCGAFAWQRIRPRAIPDLRGMPERLR
jgi:uncharacterized membrane protein